MAVVVNPRLNRSSLGVTELICMLIMCSLCREIDIVEEQALTLRYLFKGKLIIKRCRVVKCEDLHCSGPSDCW